MRRRGLIEPGNPSGLGYPPDVAYGRVSQVISAVRDGGFKKFTFVSGPEDIAKGPSKR